MSFECQYEFTRGPRRGQECRKKSTDKSHGALKLCRAHEPFPLDSLPLLALSNIAGRISKPDVLLALSYVSRSLSAATLDPTLWDKFYDIAMRAGSVADDFSLTLRQKLNFALDLAKSKNQCLSCMKAEYSTRVPCFLCAECKNKIFIESRVVIRYYGVDPRDLEGLRESQGFMLRNDIERWIGWTLEENLSRRVSQKRELVVKSALSMLAKGPLPAALSAVVEFDVEKTMSSSAVVKSITVLSPDDECIKALVNEVMNSRISQSLEIVLPGYKDFLPSSSTLAKAIKESKESHSLDGISSLPISTVVRESAVERNSLSLRKIINTLVAETGISFNVESLSPSDSLDSKIADTLHKKCVLEKITREMLLDAPGKFAGHEDARHRLYVSIDDVYSHESDTLLNSHELDDIIAWFSARNSNANREICKYMRLMNCQTCPLCTWCMSRKKRKHAQQNQEQLVWIHLREKHGVWRSV